MKKEIKTGLIYKHKLTKEPVLCIAKDEQGLYICRRLDMSAVAYNENELTIMNEWIVEPYLSEVEPKDLKPLGIDQKKVEKDKPFAIVYYPESGNLYYL